MPGVKGSREKGRVQEWLIKLHGSCHLFWSVWLAEVVIRPTLAETFAWLNYYKNTNTMNWVFCFWCVPKHVGKTPSTTHWKQDSLIKYHSSSETVMITSPPSTALCRKMRPKSWRNSTLHISQWTITKALCWSNTTPVTVTLKQHIVLFCMLSNTKPFVNIYCRYMYNYFDIWFKMCT